MARQTSQSITNSRSLLKLMFIVSWGMPPNHLILCHPLLLLPSIFPSISVFSSESALHIRWPKYWSFSFNISPSNEYSGLISFRMDWLDLLAVQGTQESSPTPRFKSSQILILYLPTLSSLSGLFQSTFPSVHPQSSWQVEKYVWLLTPTPTIPLPPPLSPAPILYPKAS